MALKYLGAPGGDNPQLATRRYVDGNAKTYLPVANGTHFNGNWGFASTSLIQTRCRQSRKMLRVIAGGATELQVEWANKYTTTVAQSLDATCEMPGPNAVTVRMAIEYPAGKPRVISGSTAYSAATAYALRDQVTNGGSKWVCIQAGTGQTPAANSAFWRIVNTYVVRWDDDTDTSGTVVFAPDSYKRSKALPLLEPTSAGDLIAVLGAFDSGSSTNYIPYAGANGASNHGLFTDWVVDAAGGLPAVGSALPDTGVTTQTQGNTTTLNDSNNQNWMKIPYATAVTGNIPVKSCVALFGDSIAQGFGGDIRDGEPCGIFPRAVDGTSWWRVAQGGNKAQCYTATNAPWQFSVVQRCSATMCSMGLNDISDGSTVAVVKTRLERLWRALAAQGPPLFIGMLTPISNSTDAWATPTNQTRYTGGGSVPTTQYPTDDPTYLTSVYGQVAMWVSQDGAPMTVDGTTFKIGQVNHPVESLLDWTAYLRQLSTSWKWANTATTDGAHPTSAFVALQSTVLQPQMEPVLTGNQVTPQPVPHNSPMGLAVCSNMDRSNVTTLSPTSVTNTGGSTLLTVIGNSSGRWISGLRIYSGTATAKIYSLLIGTDPAKMKVLQSAATAATVGVHAISLTGAPIWAPAGTLFAVGLWQPSAVASSWGGAPLALSASMHGSLYAYVLAGVSTTDTVALSGVVNIADTVRFTIGSFRAWAEVY